MGEVSFEFKSGSSIKSSNIFENGKYPVYGGNGVRGYTNTFNYDGDFALIGRQGALSGNMNFSSGKAYFTEHAVAVKANLDNDTRFLFYLMSKLKLGRWVTQSAQPGLAVGTLLEIKSDFPIKTEEQYKVGQFFKTLDNMIALHQAAIQRQQDLKKGLLQQLFPVKNEKVPAVRFTSFTGEWEQRKFSKILKTHSFRQFLAEPIQNGEYKIVQQGDKPIVGYASGKPFQEYYDVTLFGDHTVSLYKPKSPFFIATDGVKIISADGFEGNYLFSTLERHKPESQGYKRHFTILKNENVNYTKNVEEQTKIGNLFQQLDTTISLHQQSMDKLKKIKQSLLQKMFI